MIIYTLWDSEEGDESAYTSLKAAKKAASSCRYEYYIEKVDIGKPTHSRICEIFNRSGYAVHFEVVVKGDNTQKTRKNIECTP